MGLTYFAHDGTYGDAERMIVCDTTGWEETDWHKVWSASDNERSAVVLEVINKYKGDN
jgi:hypothetical protein